MWSKAFLVVLSILGVRSQSPQKFVEVPFDGRSDGSGAIPATTTRTQRFFDVADSRLQHNLRQVESGFRFGNEPAQPQDTFAHAQRQIPQANLFQTVRINQETDATRPLFEPAAPPSARQDLFNRPLQFLKQLERAAPAPANFRPVEQHRFKPGPVSVRTNTNPSSSFLGIGDAVLSAIPEATETPFAAKQHNELPPFLGRLHPTTSRPVIHTRPLSAPSFHDPNAFQGVRETPRVQDDEPLSVRSGNTAENQERLFREQAQNAHYSFASHVDDTINDQQLEREEVRDGTKVTGMYSYKDGYVKRTVHYRADENGFAIIKQEEEPLGDGPAINPNGQANVRAIIDGNTVNYSITSADIPKQKGVLQNPTRNQI